MKKGYFISLRRLFRILSAVMLSFCIFFTGFCVPYEVYADTDYTPNIYTENGNIELWIEEPVDGAHPAGIGTYEYNLDPDYEWPKIRIGETWTDSNGSIMTSSSTFENGKTYTYKAVVDSITLGGYSDPPDLRGYDLYVWCMYGYYPYDWNGSTPVVNKEQLSINQYRLTYEVTFPVKRPHDLGTCEVDLSGGSYELGNELQSDALDMTLRKMQECGVIKKSGGEGLYDIDGSGKTADISAKFKEEKLENGEIRQVMPFTVRQWNGCSLEGNTCMLVLPDDICEELESRNESYFSKVKIRFSSKTALYGADIKCADIVYDGKTHMPDPVVKAGGAVLKKGTDYTVEGTAKKNVGDYKASVKGKNNCLGKEQFTYRICYKDVPTSHSYSKAVYWATAKGIASGYTGSKAGLFGVKDDITRGQVVMFLWRAAGKPEPQKNSQTFKDVPTKHAFYKAIQWAVEKGITGGYTGSKAGYFGPNDNCTRGQIATFLWRYDGRPAPHMNTQTFSDVPVNHSFYKAVQWASEQGITAGYKDGTFGVNRTCTRGQCVTFLYRMLK